MNNFNEQFLSNFTGNSSHVNFSNKTIFKNSIFAVEDVENNTVKEFQELLLTNYSAIHIYKDFINDYITGETGQNMIKLIEDKCKNPSTLESEITLLKETNGVEGVESNYTAYRNFEELDYFNSLDDNENLLSQDNINHFIEEYKKSGYIVENENNQLTISKNNTTAKVFLAILNNATKTEGNHFVASSNNYSFLVELLEKTNSIKKFNVDGIFGFTVRNPLYSTSGIKVNINFGVESLKDKINLEKLKTIAEKNDFRLERENKEKYVFRNIYSISLNIKKVMESGQSFAKEVNALLN